MGQYMCDSFYSYRMLLCTEDMSTYDNTHDLIQSLESTQPVPQPPPASTGVENTNCESLTWLQESIKNADTAARAHLVATLDVDLKCIA